MRLSENLRDLPRRLLAFGGVGLASTLVCYAVYLSAYKLTGAYQVAAIASWGAGMAVTFLGNRRVAFRRDDRASAAEVLRFVVGASLQLLLGWIGYWFTLERLGLGETVSFCLVLLPSTAFSFLWLSVVVFPARRGQASSSGRTAQATF